MNPIIDKDGTKRWFNIEGQLHRTDGPAIEWTDGYNSWYLNGKLHRTDGPAVEYANGNKYWYLNGTELSEDLFLKLTKDPVKNLPLYLGMGFDEFLSERIKNKSNHCSINERKDIYVRIYGDVHSNRRNTSSKVL